MADTMLGHIEAQRRTSDGHAHPEVVLRFASDDDLHRFVIARAQHWAEPGAHAYPNTGHGHVWPRPDGVKARCGGPGMCSECSRDQAQFGKA